MDFNAPNKYWVEKCLGKYRVINPCTGYSEYFATREAAEQKLKEKTEPYTGTPPYENGWTP